MITSQCQRKAELSQIASSLAIKKDTSALENLNFQYRDEYEGTTRANWLLAINPNTSPLILDYLSSFEDMPSLLERVAENPQTSAGTLTRLANHDNPRVRAAVAENSHTPEKIMSRLANDIHPDVRMRLAESYFLPRCILESLCEDANPYVQNRARKTLRRIDQPLVAVLSIGCC